MTLREVFAECGFKTFKWSRDLFKTEIHEDTVSVTMDEISLDTPVELVYYWYDGLARCGPNADIVKTISKALKEHDWETFVKYYEDDSLAKNTGIRLPDHITVFMDNRPKMLGLFVMAEEPFKLIEFNKYECG